MKLIQLFESETRLWTRATNRGIPYLTWDYLGQSITICPREKAIKLIRDSDSNVSHLSWKSHDTTQLFGNLAALNAYLSQEGIPEATSDDLRHLFPQDKRLIMAGNGMLYDTPFLVPTEALYKLSTSSNDVAQMVAKLLERISKMTSAWHESPRNLSPETISALDIYYTTGRWETPK
jgi:hypothetical protein